MTKAKLFVLPFALLAAGLLMLGGRAQAAADTCIWTGAGTDQNFTTAANWSTCDNSTTPEAGDTLEFPANITNRAPVNDMPADTSFAAINFTGNTASPDCTASDDSYTITGASITLAGNVTSTMSGSCFAILSIQLDITASTNFSVVTDSLSRQFEIGKTDGTGTLTMGANSLTLSGTGGSFNLYGTFTGTTITKNGSDGGLTLNGDYTGLSGVITGNGGYITFFTSDLPPAGIVSADGSTLGFTGVDTIAVPITLTGDGASLVDTAKLIIYSGYGGSSTDITTMTGTVTLSNDVDLRLDRVLDITGTVNGNFTMNVMPGQLGKLTLNASTNNSAMVNGEYVSELLSTTYSTDVSASTAVYVTLSGNNEAVVDNGGKIGTVNVVGGILKGIGTTGDISMGSGTIAPGMSPGCLSSGNLTYTGGTVQIELGGTTVCTEYDQQTVTGTVDLGSATDLTVTRYGGFTPAVGDSFTIISNDVADAVTGTFNGMAEGATFTQDGVTYRINYGGGDGNDVVLTVTAVPATPNTGIQKITTPVLAVILIAVSAVGLVFVARRMNKSRI